MPKKRIALIFAGGTICMAHDPKTNALRPAHTVRLITEACPGLREQADIETFVVTDVDSTNITHDHWLALAKLISEQLANFDGFVVTHGTDTMSYSASALSFLLQGLPKPVIFTGSQLPLTHSPGSNAQNNLIYAAQFAGMDVAEVCICFASKLLRGNRSKKISTFEFDAFRTINFSELGRFGTKPSLSGRQRSRSKKKPKVFSKLEPRVAVLQFFTTMPAALLKSYADLGYRGLVIEAVGPGNLPTRDLFAEEIAALTAAGIPVVITSQCIYGGVDLSLYEVGRQLFDAGAISGKDMTTEAAYTKLMWALAEFDKSTKIRSVMEQDIAGELSS